jgi:hypothetical protein
MKNIYTTVLILIMGLGLLMIGCGGTAIEPTNDNLAGVWTSGCSAAGDLNAKRTFTFDPNVTDSRTFDEDYYLDGLCGTFLFKILTTSETTLTGEEFVISEEESVWGYDHEIVDITLTPTAIAIQYGGLNDGDGMCGINNWVADQPQSILGRTCSDVVRPSEDDLLEEVLQLLADEETGDLTLKLGLDDVVGGDRELELGTATYTQ